MIHYYVEIAPFLLPHLADRIVTRKRWVNGVGTAGNPGEVFFEKNLPESAPSWIRRVEIQHKSHHNTYPVFSDAAGAGVGRPGCRPRAARAAVEGQPSRHSPEPGSTRSRPRPRPGCRPRRMRRGRQAGQEAAGRARPRSVPGHQRKQGHPSVRGARRRAGLRLRQRVREGVRQGAGVRAARSGGELDEEGAAPQQGARRLEPEQRRQDHDRSLLAPRDPRAARRDAPHLARAERPRPAPAVARRGAGADEAAQGSDRPTSSGRPRRTTSWRSTAPSAMRPRPPSRCRPRCRAARTATRS